MIKTPFAKNGMFASPETDASLTDYIEGFSGQEKVLAYTVSGMTWNRAVDKMDSLRFDDIDVSIEDTSEVLWVTVGNISVRIVRTDEGAVCDMYTKGTEDLDDAHLAACYAFFQEASTDEEDEVAGHPI